MPHDDPHITPQHDPDAPPRSADPDPLEASLDRLARRDRAALPAASLDRIADAAATRAAAGPVREPEPAANLLFIPLPRPAARLAVAAAVAIVAAFGVARLLNTAPPSSTSDPVNIADADPVRAATDDDVPSVQLAAVDAELDAWLSALEDDDADTVFADDDWLAAADLPTEPAAFWDADDDLSLEGIAF